MGSRAYHKWTTEEDELLEDLWSRYTIPGIAEKMDRSIDAIQNRAKNLKLGRHLHAKEDITINQLLEALGVSNSYTWYVTKFKKHGIPIKYKKSMTVRKYAMIGIDEFWKWAEQNKKILNFAFFEKGMLGAEPKWVEMKRNNDLSNPARADHNKLWSKRDDDLLVQKVRSNRYTYADLATEFNRTQASIKRRLMDLKVPCRPVPQDFHCMWTDDEHKKLEELCSQGYDAPVIAKILNRSELSILDKIYIKAKSKVV